MNLHLDFIPTPEQLRGYVLSRTMPTASIAKEMGLSQSAVIHLKRGYLRCKEAKESGSDFYELSYATGATLDRVLVPAKVSHKWSITKDYMRHLISSGAVKLGGGAGALKRIGPKATKEILAWIGAVRS